MKNKLKVVVLVTLTAFTLSGCTMPGWFNSFNTNTNAVDTGYFSKVVVTYGNKDKAIYQNVKVFPYNNGGDDSTGGKLEIRKTNKVIVLPDDAQVELFK